MRNNPKISLCMIVKDEEALIAQCIKSVADLAAEVIVVDTGSQDNTVKIARQLGALVFHRAWDHDFSAPRNLSIEKACGDWILVLDADEAIDQSDHPRIRQLISDRSNCYALTQRHYCDDPRLSGFHPVKGEYPQWEQKNGGFFESSCVRLFPHHCGIEYRGRIHELVEPCLFETKKFKIIHSGILIHHYGHVKGVREKKDKGTLYTALGKQKLVEQPRDWKGYFEMAVEHQVNGRFNESIEAFLKSLELAPQHLASWVNLGYVLGESGRYAEAAHSLATAIQLDPKCDEAYCNLGVVHMRTQSYEKAARCFLKALALNETYINAYCNLGDTMLLMGRAQHAMGSFRKALELVPRCAKAKEGMGKSMLALGRLEESRQMLEDAIKEDLTLVHSYYWLSQIHRLTDNIAEAISTLNKIAELHDQKQIRIDPALAQACKKECLLLSRFA